MRKTLLKDVVKLYDTAVNAQAVLGDRVREGSATGEEIETYKDIKKAVKKLESKTNKTEFLKEGIEL